MNVVCTFGSAKASRSTLLISKELAGSKYILTWCSLLLLPAFFPPWCVKPPKPSLCNSSVKEENKSAVVLALRSLALEINFISS